MASVVEDSQASEEHMLDFLKDQSKAEGDFRKTLLELEARKLESDRDYRHKQLMLENMTPEDRRTFVRDEMKKQEENMYVVTYSRDHTRSYSMHQEQNIQVLDPYNTLLVKATPRRLGNMSKRNTIGLNLSICLICNYNT